MDDISAYARSSNDVDESKSARLLRFRPMPGDDARAFRKDGHLNSKFFNSPLLAENHLKTMEKVEWNISRD